MATITLYAGKVNQMSNLINKAQKSVIDHKTKLISLTRKLLTIDSSVSDVDDVISSIKSSTQTQEDKVEALDRLSKDVEEFISDVAAIDHNAADAINKSKDDFYDKHSYLKPECEKSNWEKFKDGCKKAGAWCKEHWREILIAISAVLIIVAIVYTGGSLLTFLGLFEKLAKAICSVVYLASIIYLIGCTLNVLGEIFKNKKLKTISFGLRHPIISLQIGRSISNAGKTNISTNATRFANAFDLEENGEREGSEVNAFRHAFWTSIITNRWGEDIGIQVGNAHEDNPNVINKIEDIFAHKFNTSPEADEVVDLLNNVIGREIGKKAPKNSSFKDMAKEVLDYYYENGLYTVKETDEGYYMIVKERLSYERYKNNLDTLETLDENGFPPNDKYYNKKR